MLDFLPDSATYLVVDEGPAGEIAGAVQCTDGTVQHDTCDVALWDCPSCQTDLKRQFGAKGPSCGAAASDPPVSPPPKNGGCCDAGDGAAGSALFAVGLLVLVRRRRYGSTLRQLG